MIALFTDFGLTDPYVGQMHAVLAEQAPHVPVIDLFHAVPDYHVRAGAYLLPALSNEFPPDTIFVCVVDPGVGGTRRPVVVRADDRWYVGPDNGLFHVLARRAHAVECREILWRAARLSRSFHGRDLFAPVAAMLAQGKLPDSKPAELNPPAGEWPEDLAEIIFIDHYGNAMVGLRAAGVPKERRLQVGDKHIGYAPVFSAVPPGAACWYENANGLVEIALNQGTAARSLTLKVGDRVVVV